MTDDEERDAILGLAEDVAKTMAFFTIFGFLTGTYHISMFSLIGERQARKVRRLAFQNVLRQDIAYFDKHMGGELNTMLSE